MFTRIVLNLFLLLLVSQAVFAEQKTKLEKPLPQHINGITTISADELANMLADNQHLLMIDARIQKGRSKGYITGSVHLPDVNTNCGELQKIVPSKNTKVVFYCSSSECGRSMNAVTKAQSCGYSKLYWFRGGFVAWKQKGYPYTK